MLVECIKERCDNPKPLILHSIRVGMKILELNQSKEAVVAGILHGVVEDTNCKIEKIKEKFGEKTANLVSALTQEKIKDYKKRWQILLNKIKKTGKEAMLIKVIDNNDNSIYYLPLIKDKKVLK